MTFTKLYEIGMNAGYSDRHPYFSFVNSVSGNLYGALALAFIVGLLSSAIMTYFVTRKYARSMIEIKEYFSAIRQGAEIKPLEMSKGNHFSDLADEVNGAVQLLTSRL